MNCENTPKVADYLKFNSESFGEKTAVICGDESITFNKLYEKVMESGKRDVSTDEAEELSEEEVSLEKIVGGDRSIDAVVRILAAAVGAGQDKPMYIVKTSGTTGEKKAISKYEEEVLTFMREYVSRFGITQEDVILNQLEFTFDASAKDIYAMVITGATLCIGAREMLNFPAAFIETVEKHGVTVFQTTPFFIKNMCRFDGFLKVQPRSLRKVLFVGDVMRSEYLNYWIEKLKWVKFVNLYGTSETVGNLMYHELASKVDSEFVPLTRTFDRYDVKVQEDGVRNNGEQIVGELVVYDKMQKLSINSGDLARKVGDEIYILGRADNVRKIRGYRVSLEEIERCIAECTGIKEVLTEIIEDEVYVLYETWVEEVEVRSALRKSLPRYIQPVHIKRVSQLPVNANGKSDRKKIAEYF